MSQRPSTHLPDWVGWIDATVGGASLGCDEGAHPPQVCSWGAGERSGVLFDGFLYDGGSVRREFGAEANGERMVDLLAAAWRRDGERLLDRLNGSFVLAAWDDDAGRGLVAHDALGHHPLYYVTDEGRLWFGTNLGVLARRTDRSRPDRLTLALGLLRRRPPRARTSFGGVARLEAGSWLAVDRRSNPKRVRYWQPVPPNGEPYLAPEEAAAQFESELEASVARRMELGVDGLMLSGGLDSVCIAAVADGVARRGAQAPPVAYSGRHHPEDEAGYEEEAQDRVVERLGWHHAASNQIDWLGNRELIEASLEEIARFPAPSHVAWTGSYMGFARWAAARGDRVFLTGSGGDEWLTVDPSYATDLLRRLGLRRFAWMVRAECSGLDRRLADVLRQLGWTHGLRAVLALWGQSLLPGAYARESRRRVELSVPEGSFPDGGVTEQVRDVLEARRLPRLDRGAQSNGAQSTGAVPASAYRQKLRSLWVDSYLLHEHEVGYHAQRSAGVVYLSPYHDRQLVEFLCRVPPHQLFAGGRYKGFVRGVVVDRLPGLGLGSQQKTYRERTRHLPRALREQLPATFERIGCERLADLGLVDPGALRSRFAAIEALDFGGRIGLFSALSAETWLAANM